MKPTNSHLSEIEKEGASDYPWTPVEKDSKGGPYWLYLKSSEYSIKRFSQGCSVVTDFY